MRPDLSDFKTFIIHLQEHLSLQLRSWFSRAAGMLRCALAFHILSSCLSGENDQHIWWWRSTLEERTFYQMILMGKMLFWDSFKCSSFLWIGAVPIIFYQQGLTKALKTWSPVLASNVMIFFVDTGFPTRQILGKQSERTKEYMLFVCLEASHFNHAYKGALWIL